MAARSIEARLVISGEDKASAEIAKVIKALKETEKASGFSEKVGRLAKAFTDVERQAKAAQGVLDARGPLERTVKSLAAAERETARLAREFDGARKAADAFGKASAFTKGSDQAQQASRLAEEVKRVAEAHRGAEREVAKLTKAFNTETTALRQAEAEASRLGADLSSLERHQANLARQTDLATKALRHQIATEEHAARAAAHHAARRDMRRDAVGTVASGAAIIAAQRGKDLGQRSVLSLVDFDYATRKQQAFAGISKADQDRLLIPQAFRIGKDTKFSNTDIINAQTTIAQRLPKNLPIAEVTEAITQQVQYYAQALGADMKTSAESLTAYMLSTGKDLSTAEAARKAALRSTNLLIQGAKLAGSTDDDIQAFNRFGVQPGSQAGFSDPMLIAFQAGMKRSGINGDQAGTALRTISARFLAPTQKGQAAMAAAGIDYMKHVKMPEALSVEAMERKFQLDFGRSFSRSQRSRLHEVLSDPEAVGNRESFVEEVSAIQMESFSKNRKGKYNAADQNKVAKKAYEFHKFNQENVDVGSLLIEILRKDPSLGVLNAIVTDKHGGKVGGLSKMLEYFLQDLETLKKVPDGFGKGISDTVTGGVGGSFEKLKGSVETFTLSIGRANEGILKLSFDKLGDTIDKFSELPQWAQQSLSIGGAGVATAGAAAGAWTLGKKLLGFGPLDKSAAALTASAAELSAAAAALGGKGGVDKAAAGAAASGGALAAGAVVGGVAAGGAAASVIANEAIKNPDFAAPYLDGGMLAADPGGYGLGAAIMNAPEIRKRLDEANRLAPRMTLMPEGMSLPGGMTLNPGGVPLTLGSGGARFGLGRGANAIKAGEDAGSGTIQGIVQGLQKDAPKVEEQGRSLFERLKAIFADGIKVQVRVEGGDGLSGSAGDDGLKGSAGGDTLGGGLGAGTGSGRGGLRRLGGGGGSVVPNGESGPGTGTGDSWYEAVMRAEGTAGKDPYNVVLGKGKYGLPSKPLTDMTLAEAYRFGRTVRARHGSSSAIGAFQIVGRTMKEHMKHTGLGWDDRFSPENQRKLAGSIRQREGWGAWEGLKIHRGELARARRGSGVIADAPRKPDAPDGKRTVDRPEIPNPIPQAPPGGLGRGSGDLGAAADRMAAAAARMEQARFHGRVDVAVSGGQAKGMRMLSSQGMTADLGYTMPDLPKSGRDWA